MATLPEWLLWRAKLPGGSNTSLRQCFLGSSWIPQSRRHFLMFFFPFLRTTRIRVLSVILNYSVNKMRYFCKIWLRIEQRQVEDNFFYAWEWEVLPRKVFSQEPKQRKTSSAACVVAQHDSPGLGQAKPQAARSVWCIIGTIATKKTRDVTLSVWPRNAYKTSHVDVDVAGCWTLQLTASTYFKIKNKSQATLTPHIS